MIVAMTADYMGYVYQADHTQKHIAIMSYCWGAYGPQRYSPDIGFSEEEHITLCNLFPEGRFVPMGKTVRFVMPQTEANSVVLALVGADMDILGQGHTTRLNITTRGKQL